MYYFIISLLKLFTKPKDLLKIKKYEKYMKIKSVSDLYIQNNVCSCSRRHVAQEFKSLSKAVKFRNSLHLGAKTTFLPLKQDNSCKFT